MPIFLVGLCNEWDGTCGLGKERIRRSSDSGPRTQDASRYMPPLACNRYPCTAPQGICVAGGPNRNGLTPCIY
jgi:hypothetical protein